MRFGFAITSMVLLSAAVCSGNTLTDTFGQAQGNCNLSSSAPYSTCDVIGDPHLFDIQSVTFSNGGGLATVMIYLNSGAVKTVNGQLILGAFSDGGVTLIPGDIFFYNSNTVYDPSDPTTTQYLKYGVPLVNHGAFVAGDLYAIGGATTVETAQQALNNNSDYYRRNEGVLMAGNGSALTAGTVSVANSGNGTSSAQYLVTVTFPTTSGFLDLMSSGQLGLLFSSADCGNDVIQGSVGGLVPASQTPEPGPMYMMIAGIGLLAFGRQWRKQKGQ